VEDDRVAKARVARLATVAADGQPHVVPIVFVLDGDTLYSAVDEKPKRTRRLQRLRDIEASPRVEVLIDAYDEEWSRLWWVKLRGTARIVERDARALELLQGKYEQYQAEPPAGPFVVVRVDERLEWQAT
jgi:PPOX class probable F420-dependent enzyme